MINKWFRFGILICGLCLVLIGIFMDLIRGMPMDIGFSQWILIFLGIFAFFLGFYSKNINFIEQYELYKHNRFYQEVVMFSGFLILLVDLNYPVLTGSKWIFSIFHLPFLLIGLFLIVISLYFSKRNYQPDQAGISTKRWDKLAYRPEIDGMRALAVIPVLLYHLKVPGFEGGFVGVDVFFVISGFLITGIIYREIEYGHFSIANFYERRIRRIFPALFIVLLFIGVTGIWFFDPDTFKELGQSIFSTSLFTSNFLFYHQSGYFDKPAELKPLLHTWSLALEEQFYIFFPLFFLLIWRIFKKHFKLVLFLCTLGSLALSIIWISRDPSAAFYLLPFRAWELLLGSLLAIGLFPAIKNQRINNILGMLGLCMILMAVFTFSAQTPFPGAAALLPTVGAFLIIYATSEVQTYAASFLSWRPFVFTGKISYSLYLWHWVIIVLARYYNILPLSAWQNVVIFFSSFVISGLTWKYIENPFRNKAAFNRQKIFAFGFAATAMIGAAGFWFYQLDGLPNRYPFLPPYYNKMIGDNPPLEACISNQTRLEISDPGAKDNYDLISENVCHLGNEESPVSFAVIGDSHANSIAYGIDELSKQDNLHGVLLLRYTCPIASGIDVETNHCNDYQDLNISYVLNHPEIKTVFLISRWALYANGTGDQLEEGKTFPLRYVGQTTQGTLSENKEILAYGIDQVISKLEEKNKQVIFVNDAPEVGYKVPQSFFIAELTGREVNRLIAPSVEVFTMRYQAVFDILDELLLKHPSLQIINLSNALCDQQSCMVEKDGIPLYRDDDHLNAYGSLLVADEFKVVFEGIKP
jgi:peptidoglycan/LPS O-acetylase OafA/YrhL